MDFAREFAVETAVALSAGWIVVSWHGARLAALLPSLARSTLEALPFAPLLGMALIAVTGSLLYMVAPLTPASVAWHLVGLAAGLELVHRLRGPADAHPEQPVHQAKPGGRAMLGLWLAALIVGALAITEAVPFVQDGGLYVAAAMHDHARLVFADAIARHGLPVPNPLYAPGEALPLSYYYLWSLLAAMLEVGLGVTGWPADAALSWLSLAATLGGCAGLAACLFGRARAGFAALALGLCGSLRGALPPAAVAALGLAPEQGFDTLAQQARWAPHHVLASGALVLALWLVAALPRTTHSHARRASCVASALLGSFAATSSGWVAVGLAIAAPALLGVLWQRQRAAGLGAALGAGLLALALALPTLLTVASPPCAPAGSVIGVGLWRSVEWSEASLVQLLAYWLLFVPGLLLPALVAAALGAFGTRLPTRPHGTFRALSVVSILGTLLVCQLLRSTIANNDLGWRANLLAQALCLVWGGVGLGAWCSPQAGGPRLSGAPRLALSGLAAVLLAAGLWALRLAPGAPPRDVSEAAHHVDFLEQARAWRLVRSHAGVHDRVLSNPDGFTDLVPWPINLDYLLFANRDSVFVNPNWVLTYCPGAEPELFTNLRRTVSSSFERDAHPQLLRALRDRLHVRVLLVHRDDGVFASDAIERSGAFRLLHAESRFKIYGAR